jgi:molybdopterin-guanine dinucleotide biosynthesis protein A
MGTHSDLAAFILAGGKSTRMGTDKAFVTIDGVSLLSRALDVARSVTSSVRIVGDSAKFAAFAPVVEDVFAGCGPLGGIHAALRGSEFDLNLILAVDLPFLSPALLRHLIERARSSASAGVIVPLTAHGWQPLCAIYRRQFTYIAEKALRERRYKIDTLFEMARAQAIHEEELRTAGFSPDLFRNLNTPEDLAMAREANASFS